MSLVYIHDVMEPQFWCFDWWVNICCKGNWDCVINGGVLWSDRRLYLLEVNMSECAWSA